MLVLACLITLVSAATLACEHRAWLLTGSKALQILPADLALSISIEPRQSLTMFRATDFAPQSIFLERALFRPSETSADDSWITYRHGGITCRFSAVGDYDSFALLAWFRATNFAPQSIVLERALLCPSETPADDSWITYRHGGTTCRPTSVGDQNDLSDLRGLSTDSGSFSTLVRSS